MTTEWKFIKFRPDDYLEQQYNFKTPNQEHGKQFWEKIAVMVILTTGIALHTLSLATSNLARFETTSVYSDFYHAQLGESASTEIDMGLWKMCSRAWEPRCVSWDRSSKLDAMTSGLKYFEAPGWLQAAQGTSITGIVIAVITDVIVLLHLVVPDKGARLFPFLICLGALIGGTFVFISCACVAFNYKSIPKHVGLLTSAKRVADDGFVWKETRFFYSIGWGLALQVVSIVLMWLSGLFIVLSYRRIGKRDGKKGRLFTIFS